MTINPVTTPSAPASLSQTQAADRTERQALLKDLFASAQKGDVAQAKIDADKLKAYADAHNAKAGPKPAFFDFLNKVLDAVKSGDAEKLKTAYTSGIKDFRADTGVTAKNETRKAAFLAERAAEIASGGKDADDTKPAANKPPVNASGLPSAINITA